MPNNFQNNAGKFWRLGLTLILIFLGVEGFVFAQINSAPVINNQPTNQTVVSGFASFSVSASGSGPLTYQWLFNGQPIPIISTVAGNGQYYATGGASATNAALLYPEGLVLDCLGNVFFADSGHNRIRQVKTNGSILTLAGNGTNGFTGDGGLATQAGLTAQGVALDTFGNIYIADTSNNRIRRVNTNGVINTVAGNGTNGFAGDGGSAILAELKSPRGVAVDSSGNLYIADTGNNRIRFVGTNNTIITIAGNGFSGFATNLVATNSNVTANGLALDNQGNIYIANEYRVRKIMNGMLYTLAGTGGPGFSGDGGPATNAKINSVQGLAVDIAGNVYFADTGNNRIRKISTNGTISTVAGNGSTNYSGDGGFATNAGVVSPNYVAVDPSGNIFIPDAENNRIREVTTNGVISTVIKNNFGDGEPATNASVCGVEGIIFDNRNNLFIADTSHSLVRRLDTNGIITTVAGNGYQSGFSWGDGGQATNATLITPNGVAVDASGNLLIADLFARIIRKVDTNGIIQTLVGAGTNLIAKGMVVQANDVALGGWAGDVALDPHGNIYIGVGGPTTNNHVYRIDANNNISVFAGIGKYGYSGDQGSATNAELNGPLGVAVDFANNVYIADQYNNRIRKVDTNGVITTLAGSGVIGYAGDNGFATNAALLGPANLAPDLFGNVYIADTFNSRVRKVDTNGIITTVAGNGGTGFSGDGGPAINARLEVDNGVAIDNDGILYIADTGNNRIRKVSTLGGNAVLPLNDVTINNAGNYSVIVSNPYGSVTSSIATLNVVIQPPQNLSVQLLGGDKIQLRLTGTPGLNYQLQAATDLIPPIRWQTIATNATDINGNWSFTDSTFTNYSQRYYRALLP